MKPQRTKDGVPDPKIPKGWRILSPWNAISEHDRWFDFDDCKWWAFELPTRCCRVASNYGLVIRKLSKSKKEGGG